MQEASALRVVTEERAHPEPAIRVPLGVSARCAARLLAGAAAAWALLLFGTAGFGRYLQAVGGQWSAAGWPKVLLVQLHLAGVNVAATWFASMLRLGVAVGATMCFLVDRTSLPPAARFARYVSFGWLAVAAGFAALSLDEMGSLSERVERAQAGGLLPPWASDVLAAAVLVAVVSTGLFVLLHVSRRPLALASWILGAALTLGAPVVAQLRSEDSARTSPRADPRAWTLAERGLELLASVAFLAAVAAYLVRRPGEPPSIDVRLRTAILAAAGLGATGGAAFLACAALVARLPASGLGIPQDWFTSAPAAAVAIGFGWLGRNGAARAPREALYLRAAAFCAALSLYSGACLGYWLSELPNGQRLRPLAEGAMIALAGILAWQLARSDARWWGRVAVLGWAALLSVGLADRDPSSSWREAAAFGLLGIALLSHSAVAPRQNFSVSPPTPRQ